MRMSALAGRFFSNICYNIGLQWAAEILPTVVRAQGVAFIHTMGFVAMLMSPPVVYLSKKSLSSTLIVLGALGIFGKYRTLVANLSLALFYSPFTMVMPWIALSAGNWRRFSSFTSLPIVLAMFSFCLLPESARWVFKLWQL